MVGILLLSHGGFAPGIHQSINMLFGEQKNIQSVALMPSMTSDDFYIQIKEAVSKFDDPKNILLMADIWGGTPFNQVYKMMEGHEDHWAIVTGLNLPMLIEAVVCCMRMDDAYEVANYIVPKGKDSIRTCPEKLTPKE